jgi:large-conductance mechanosensitive channel
MIIQYIIVGLIVAVAIWYIVKSVTKSAKGHSCESGACGCEKPKAKV